MSELYVVGAIGLTFFAVVLGGIAVQDVIAERRRPLEQLRRQVRPMTTNLREEDLILPLGERMFAPLVSRLGGIARRLTPDDLQQRISKKLVLAGNPAGWDADKVAAFKVIGLGGGIAFGFVLARLAGLAGSMSVISTALLGAIGFSFPGVLLSRAVAKRQLAIRRALPDSMDLLTISVEAGLGFDAALMQVTRNVPGPLSQEIGRMLHEMQLGVSRADAFRQLAARTEVDEIKGFVLAMIQADVYGVSVSKVLRAQAQDLRVKRRQRAEHKAMQVPVKLLLPMIFCVMPSLFVVIVGPGVIRVIQTFFGGGGTGGF
jgi:tight adherence protein C